MMPYGYYDGRLDDEPLSDRWIHKARIDIGTFLI